MDSITLKNFRCFREEQTVPLAPLTLLVGENSTGKTSFMAMIRALTDMAYRCHFYDFKEYPYDLGSFDEIAHDRGARGGRADTFEAGFEVASEQYGFKVVFGKIGTAPVPSSWRHTHEKVWIEQRFEGGPQPVIRLGTARGSWQQKPPRVIGDLSGDRRLRVLYPVPLPKPSKNSKTEKNYIPLSGSPAFTSEDWNSVESLNVRTYTVQFARERPSASAPVRSKPFRTYDPAPMIQDFKGKEVPMYLAEQSFRDKEAWKILKGQLDQFGKDAGLFDEISIKQSGKRDSDPFQVQVRKFGDRLKGPLRNLMDVGYGVSQVLPVIVELLRPNAPRMFLLQQPEVHLHPSAQAALGSLFCRTAAQGRQLIVETHSDYLMDRVRMEVRDGGSGLKPEDVSLLYFERGELDVRIHSLRFDEQGNVLGAPPSYRRFFMEETERSLWKRS